MIPDFLQGVPVQAAMFYAVLGFVVAWATVILGGQFWVMWQARYEPRAVRRVRDLGRVSDAWMPGRVVEKPIVFPVRPRRRA